MQRLTTSLARRALPLTFFALIPILLVACARPVPPLALESLPRTTIEVDEVAFELPGRGWIQGALRDGFHVTRVYGRDSSQGVAIWRVPVPGALQGLSPQQHAEKYFDAERNAPRQPMLWEGFQEGVRQIGEARHPVMTVRLTDPQDARHGEGLFLIFFPPQFAASQTYYVLMWVDMHPAGIPGRGLAMFDFMMPTFRVKPSSRTTQDRREPST